MKLVSFDWETFLFRPGLPTPRPVCGSWSNDGVTAEIATAPDAIDVFASILRSGDHMVGVNIAYDVVVSAAYRPGLLPLIFEAGDASQIHCCALMEALHDIAIDKLFEDYETGQSFAKGEDFGGRYSMAILAKRHLGLDISAEKEGGWRYRYAELDGVPISEYPEEAREYPKRDALRTYAIRAKQKTHRNRHDEPAQVRAAIAIQLMRTWGFRTDPEYLDHLEKEVDGAWHAARDEFAKVGIYRANGTKDKRKLEEMVTAAYGGHPLKTPKGNVITDRDTLVESGDPILEKLGASGKNDKRKTQYIPALRRGCDVPLTTEFNVLVATGRVSSDFQQLPQKGGIREGVIARPGTVICSLDFAGLELRTMSERAIQDPDIGFSKMADYLNMGKDAHSYVAGFFLGLTLEQFLERKGELKAYRDVAKMFNFGAGGGAGAFAIAYNAKVKENIHLCLSLNRAEKCGVRKVEGRINGKPKLVCSLCVEIARELKEKWLQAWLEQGLLARKAGRLTANGRKVDAVIPGSRRVRGGCGYSQWLNSPFQGAGGDGVKRAMWAIAREQYTRSDSPLWGSHVVLNVHDELWIEFPDDSRRHDGPFEAARIMVAEMDKVTPHVKNECTPAIMRRVFKLASDVYDRSGKLRPWWPTDAGQPWTWGPDQKQMRVDLDA